MALFSCGKKAGDKSDGTKHVDPIQPDDFETYLQGQSITCEDKASCPTYIAKVVVRSGPGNYKVCTGFLTDANTVATSTTCLSKLLRLTGQDCHQDVAFFFTKPFAPALRVGCKEVLQASENYSSDPVYNRDDLAFLKLDTSLPFRRSLGIVRDGIPNNKGITFVGVEQTDGQNGMIREVNCTSVQNSYVNPLVSNDVSPGVTLAGCTFANGFTGAPIIDYKSKNRVRGVVTQAMDSTIRKYLQSTGLLVNGLKDFIHGTNLACSPTIYGTDVADDRECNKDLTEFQLEKLRTNMLSTPTIFGDFKTRLETVLESNNKYIRYTVKLTPKASSTDPTKPNYDIQDVSVTPKCFKDLDAMGSGKVLTIQNFKRPSRTFKKMMDDMARVQGQEVDNGSSTFNINFSPKEVQKNKFSTIYFWDGQTGNTLETYPNIPVCN